MNNDVRQLVEQLQNNNVSPGDKTYLRRGVVTAVATSTATVTIGGASVAGVPFHRHTQPKIDDVVDVLFDGPSARIIGVVGSLAWTNVTFQNSWTNFGLGYNDAQYRREANGVVRLRGLIKSGTMGSIAFTLPTGFRPPGHSRFAAQSAVPGIAVITVQIDGGVFVDTGASATNANVSLEGITFPAA